MILDMFFAEIFGILVSEDFIEMFAGISEFLRTGKVEREIGKIDDTFERGHLFGIDFCGYYIAHEEHLALAVVYDVVNLFGLELILYRNHDGTIGNNGQKATAHWLLFRPQTAILSPFITPLFSNRMWSFSIFLATS